LAGTSFQSGSGQDTTTNDTYVGSVLATSPPPDPLAVVPAISGLHIEPCSMPSRISTLFKILVSPSLDLSFLLQVNM
jgi:hypothetical protein